MRSRASSLNGECQIRRLIELSIVNRPQVNVFKLFLNVTYVASCEERDSGPRAVTCSNESTDQFATLQFFTHTVCGACDTSCPPDHLISTGSQFDRSKTGMPAKYQRLRNLMNNQCYELGDDRDVSDSLRTKIGPDTIDGGSLMDAVMAELETLFPSIKDLEITCADVARMGTCDCGSPEIIASKYSSIN